MIPLVCHGQNSKSIYRPYKNTADSIVSIYLGDEIFKQYVKLDSSKSEFLFLKRHWDNKAKFDEELDFKPNVFEFNYVLSHPGLVDESFTISFMLDSAKELMWGFNPVGLIDLTTNNTDLKIISKKDAVKISEKMNIKKPIDRFRVELGWRGMNGDYQKYKKTKDLRDMVKGKLVWRVLSNFREEPKAFDEEPYTEVFIIDALTGEYLSTEFHAIDWE